MKLRLLCALAMLFAVAGGGHAADKNGEASGKKLIVPSVEMGGGSIGVSTDKPNDPNVPGFNDPAYQDKPVEPFVGLKFNKPLGGK
jgi:hypothetical protein